MSYWTHVTGSVVVSPLGRTQAEMRYILETVLDHLPKVTGSERDMNVYIIQKNGYNSSSSHTEFGEYGGYRDNTLSLKMQTEYILVLDGSLRDREFEQTYREFQKWLCRLAKRVCIIDILINISGWNKSTIIQDKYSQYYKMFEWPSWCVESKKDNDKYKEPNWCEYLMWERAKNYDYPMMLAYKYFNDPENDVEVERRINWRGGNE